MTVAVDVGVGVLVGVGVVVGDGVAVGLGAVVDLGAVVGLGADVAFGAGVAVAAGAGVLVAWDVAVAGAVVGVLVAEFPNTFGCVLKNAPASTARIITTSRAGSPHFRHGLGSSSTVVRVFICHLFPFRADCTLKCEVGDSSR
ncbi:MAG: hypothetical protein NVSMB22_26480 [Chloroflexota bacterium]